MSEIREALRLIKAGQPEDAREIIIGMLRADQTDVKAWALMVQVAKDDKEALQSLRQILKHKPGDEWATKTLAKMQGTAAPAVQQPKPPARPAETVPSRPPEAPAAEPAPPPVPAPPAPEPPAAQTVPSRPTEEAPPPADGAAAFLLAALEAGVNVLVTGQDKAARREMISALVQEAPDSRAVTPLTSARDKPGMTVQPPLYIIQEVPDGEIYETLTELRGDGIAQTVLGIEARDAHGALNSMLMLSRLSNPDIAEADVLRAIADGIEVIVAMNPDISINQISELQGMESGQFILAEIFRRRGGDTVPTGTKPEALAAIQAAGVSLSEAVFNASDERANQATTVPSRTDPKLARSGERTTQPSRPSGDDDWLSQLDGGDDSPDTEPMAAKPDTSSDPLADASWLDDLEGTSPEPAAPAPTSDPLADDDWLSDLSSPEPSSDPLADASWLDDTPEPPQAQDKPDESWRLGGSTSTGEKDPLADADWLDSPTESAQPTERRGLLSSKPSEPDESWRAGGAASSSEKDPLADADWLSDAPAPPAPSEQKAPDKSEESWRKGPDPTMMATPVAGSPPAAEEIAAEAPPPDKKEESRNLAIIWVLGALLFICALTLAVALIFGDDLAALVQGNVPVAVESADANFAVDTSNVEQRSPIAVGDSTTGQIDSFSGVHDYILTGSAGQQVTIDVSGLTEDDDPLVEVYNTAGDLLEENDDIDFLNGNTDARVQFTLPEDGAYLIRVEMFFGSGYEITVR